MEDPDEMGVIGLSIVSACLCSYRKGEVWTEKWRQKDALSGPEALVHG